MSEFINTIEVLGDDAVIDSIIERTITEFKDDTLTKVGEYAFYKCTALETVDLPAVTYIGQYAFQDCAALREVNCPNIVTLSDGNGYTFIGCKSLESVNMPLLENIRRGYVFSDCSNLKQINFPNLTTVGGLGYWFNKTGIVEAVFPKLGACGNGMFQYCDSLVKLDFHCITSMAAVAPYCPNFETLIIRTPSVCTLTVGWGFDGSKIKAGEGYIYVPKALVDQYKAATNWSTFANQFRAIEDYPNITGG